MRLRRSGRSVEIRGDDTGQGISPEFLPNIFDPFLQADGSVPAGTAASARAGDLQAAGWTARRTLKADSPRLCRGATFTVRLPLPSLSRPASATLRPDAPELTRPPAGVRLTCRGSRCFSSKMTRRRGRPATVLRLAVRTDAVASAAEAAAAFEHRGRPARQRHMDA